MILHEYAVEPAALVGWEAFRYLTEKFGFHQGRLISNFPSKWVRELIQACDGLPDVEKKRIVEKLSHPDFKRTRLISGARLYDPAKEWLINAEEQHDKKPFHAIISRTNPRVHGAVLVASTIDEHTPLMNVPREDKFVRSAAILSKQLRLLLENSREILFVDAHFDPRRPKWRNPLAEWLRVAVKNGNTLARCEYHLANDETKLSAHLFRQACEKWLPGIVPRSLRLKLVRWHERDRGEKFHARYILTEIGGIRIDVGLDEGEPGETTDVSLMDIGIWRNAWNFFQERTSPYDISDVTEVTGVR